VPKFFAPHAAPHFSVADLHSVPALFEEKSAKTTERLSNEQTAAPEFS
jgi:hypothetical protein